MNGASEAARGSGVELLSVARRRGPRRRLPPGRRRGCTAPTSPRRSRCSTVTESAPSSTSRKPGLLEELREVALVAPASSSLVVDVGVELPGDLPERAQRAVAAAVIPDTGGDDAARPRRRGPSRGGPATGSAMKWTTSWARAASKPRPRTGAASAGAWRTSTPGWRSRSAATNGSDGSTAATAPGRRALTSSAVSAPGPAADVEHALTAPRRPRSRRTGGRAGSEYLPMNRSYALGRQRRSSSARNLRCPTCARRVVTAHLLCGAGA